MDEVKLEIRECDYRNEHYKVRFDGAVWRCKKDSRKNEGTEKPLKFFYV